MDQISEQFKILNIKATNLDEAIKVLNQKSKVLSNIFELKEDSDETRILENKIKKTMEEKESLIKEYKQSMKLIQEVQNKILMILEYTSSNEFLSSAATPVFKTFKSNKNCNNNIEGYQVSPADGKPISIAFYAKSSALKSQPPPNLKFEDFNAEFSVEEFEGISKYMRGRTTYENLYEFLNQVIISTFNYKYRILHQFRSSLKKEEIDLQIQFREENGIFDGKFITMSDILRTLNCKSVDKKDDRSLQMLRHLQILKEFRKNQVVAYIWLK
jgi:hypothetical protein